MCGSLNFTKLLCKIGAYWIADFVYGGIEFAAWGFVLRNLVLSWIFLSSEMFFWPVVRGVIWVPIWWLCIVKHQIDDGILFILLACVRWPCARFAFAAVIKCQLAHWTSYKIWYSNFLTKKKLWLDSITCTHLLSSYGQCICSKMMTPWILNVLL